VEQQSSVLFTKDVSTQQYNILLTTVYINILLLPINVYGELVTGIFGRLVAVFKFGMYFMVLKLPIKYIRYIHPLL